MDFIFKNAQHQCSFQAEGMFDRFNRHEIEMTKWRVAANTSGELSSAGFEALSHLLDTIWKNLGHEGRLVGEKLEGNCVDTPYLFSIFWKKKVSCRYEMPSRVRTYLSQFYKSGTRDLQASLRTWSQSRRTATGTGQLPVDAALRSDCPDTIDV